MRPRKPPERHEFISQPSACHKEDVYFIKCQLEKWHPKMHQQLCKDYSRDFLKIIGENHHQWQLVNKARKFANTNLRKRTQKYLSIMERKSHLNQNEFIKGKKNQGR